MDEHLEVEDGPEILVPSSVEPRELMLLGQAYRLLAEARTIGEVKDIRDKAEVMRLYLRQRGEGLHTQNAAAEIKLWAERRAGELLKSTPRHPAGRPSDNRSHDATDLPLTLAEQGFTKSESSRWQIIASVSEEEFVEHIQETKASGGELTTAGVLRLARQLDPAPQKPWTPDRALTKVRSFIASALHKSPEEFRPTLAREVRFLVDVIDPDGALVVDDPPIADDSAIDDPLPLVPVAVVDRPVRLRSPFPWFGSKSRVASLVWDRFGDVPNYIEPFFGSGAVLLRRPHDPEFIGGSPLLVRPHEPRTETVNDLDCFVSNFFRAVQAEPEAVARWVDFPVIEDDLEARQWWLTNSAEAKSFQDRIRHDPHYYYPQIAGWWAWGQCNWIGSGWCEHAHAASTSDINRQPRRARPDLGGSGKGLVAMCRNAPDDDESGDPPVLVYLKALARRLKGVRVCCGEWDRICGPAPTTGLGLTAVFLDPPYLGSTGRYPDIYARDSRDVASEARAWAVAHGDDPLFRIALCGYEGEHEMPGSWECATWDAPAGYASPRRNGTNNNARRERIWFSPNCLKAYEGRTLFDHLEAREGSGGEEIEG